MFSIELTSFSVANYKLSAEGRERGKKSRERRFYLKRIPNLERESKKKYIIIRTKIEYSTC